MPIPMRLLQTVFIVLLLGAMVYLAWVWRRKRSEDIISRWAKENGYEVISAKLRLWPGPFLFRRTEGQTVFRVHVRDGSGRERHGWLRCGGWVFGLLSNEAKVDWD